MKLLTFLLFVALVGQISAHAYPGYAYRAGAITLSEDSAEVEETQSDENDAEDEEDEPQDDDVSEENEQDRPPAFNKLFPSPKTGRPGSGGNGPSNQAFQTMMHEIDENGWKRPKENPKSSQRQRSELVAKPVFRDDDDDSEEEDEEDDAEDDEPFGDVDFDKVFPNPEGKQVGPTNMPDSGEGFGQGGSDSSGPVISSEGIPSFGRSGLNYGRPTYFTRQNTGRQSIQFGQRPTYVRASVTPVRSPVSYRQNPSYGYGNRRVVQVQPVSYRQTPSNYYGNRRVVQQYRPSYSTGGYRQPGYNMGGYRQSVYNMRQHRHSGYNMGGYRQTGPVYVNNYGRRQQYVSSPVRRQYVPASYAQRPARYSQSPYVVRMRRNQRWNSQ